MHTITNFASIAGIYSTITVNTTLIPLNDIYGLRTGLGIPGYLPIPGGHFSANYRISPYCLVYDEQSQIHW